MATRVTLIDIEAVTASILTGISGVEDINSIPPDVVGAGRRTIERLLRQYNRTHNNLSMLYKKGKDEYASMKASLESQIAAYKKQIDEERKLKEEEIRTAVAFMRKERDDVSKEADLEQEKMEKEREGIERRRREYRAQVELYKKEAREAQEIQAEAENAVIEEKETVQGLHLTVSSLERVIRDLKAESRGWETEAYNTATLRERAESALETYRAEMAPIKQRNQELKREVEKLKPALKFAQQMILDSERRFKDCEQQLKDTMELVLRQPDTPTPGVGTSKNSLLADLRRVVTPGGTIQDSDSESMKSRSPASLALTISPPPNQEELAREKERYRKLEAAIDTDYVPLETYERDVSDRIEELERIKAERDRIQQANDNCQTALKQLQIDLADKEEENKAAKKDSARVKELKAKIKELEKKIAALEAEAKASSTKQRDRQDLEKQLETARDAIARLEKRARTLEGEVKTHKDRAQDQEKRLKQASERIAKLEKRELQQQTMIATLQKNAGARGPASPDEDGEVRRLTDALLAARKEADDADTALQKEKERVHQSEQRYKAQQRLLETAEAELAEAELKHDGFRRAAEQHQEVEEMLLKELHEGEETRANLLQAIQSMLQPNIETDSIQHSLSNEVLDLIELRRDAFRFQEQLIPMAQAAAQDYGAITGEGFVVEGHGRDNGRQYISDPEHFGRSIRALYERFTNSLRRSQEESRTRGRELGRLKEDLVKNKAGKEADEYRGKFEQCNLELRIAKRRAQSLELENERLRGEGEGSRPEGDGRDREKDVEYLRMEDENERLQKENKRLQGENQRLQAENKDLQETVDHIADDPGDDESGGLQSDRLKACESDRERLEKENKRLKDKNKRLQDQINAAGGWRDPDNNPDDSDDDGDDNDNGGGDGNGDDNNDPGALRQLSDENRLLKDVVQRLNDEMAILMSERRALRDEVRDQALVINGNGEQADRTQAALNGQIAIFEGAQLQLMRDIEALNLNSVQQGRMAAESSRNLRFAREEIDRYKNLVTTLTIERDLLQDEVRLCVEAQQRARRRARENAGAGSGPVPGDDTRPAGAGAGAGAGAEVVRASRPGFFGRAYAYLFRTVPYTMVWTTQLTVFVMMVAIIIAEGGRHAEWRAANQHTRALYMSLQNQPVLCLARPSIDYFWHTFAALLTGRWKFRWS
ncbi:hypothetical protein F5X98DRAFT_376459 [Xylaria grammica]|nr:hypothetical protein F5X98DRAFT_376459 [Xylaria grammica]